MCGIAGYKTNHNIEPTVLDNMVSALIHRGPDSSGYYKDEFYNAGMRRLSINGIESGNQPLYNQNKNVVLLYNGEIYNSLELRKDLQKKGYKFKTNSDGEVICHLYDEYQEECFDKLDGMFAIAMWIVDQRKLFLARDLAGEKPLYYSCLSNNEIVFSSELKSLKLFPKISKELNYQAIWDFPTFLWIPEPDTVYKNIHAVMPGELLIIDEKEILSKQIINTFETQLDEESDEYLIYQTKKIVEQSVKRRLLSDVPIGSFLSGGLDSSIVSSIAAKNLDTLDTFTIGFENVIDPYHGMADESTAARSFANKLNTNHHEIKITGNDFNGMLDKFCEFGDQPFAVSSGLGLLAIAKASNQANIKVLLSGDGADELFGGYSWYEFLPQINHLKNILEQTENISFQNIGMSSEERVKHLNTYNYSKTAWALHYYASEKEKQKIFSDDIIKIHKSSLRYFDKFNVNKKWSSLDFIKQDREFYLPNEMLKKMDRMSMAYSVEGRAPFVSPSILSFVKNLRFKHLIKDNKLKWILRKAFESDLPLDIIDRPKHGFNVPVDNWLKNSWSSLIDETFSDQSYLRKNNIVNKNSLKYAQKMIKNPNRLNGHTIFCYIMLNKWLENYYD